MMRNILKKLSRKLGLFNALRYTGIRLQAATGRVHDAEYFHLPSHLDGGVLIDVGANLGQSIVSLHKLFPRSNIIAFEPNPACKELLSYFSLSMKKSLMVYHVGLGDFDGELTFSVPELEDGIKLLQEGSFDQTVFFESVTIKRIREPFKLHKIPIPIQRLDDYCLNPSLIKIDVQGFEMQVLYGAAQTIARSRPVLLLERDRRTEEKIKSFMDGFGYQSLTLHLNIIYFPDPDPDPDPEA